MKVNWKRVDWKSVIALAAALTMVAACGETELRIGSFDSEAPASSETSEAIEPLPMGEVFDFRFEIDDTLEDFEAGTEALVTTLNAEAPFRGIEVFLTGANPEVEYQLGLGGGTWGPWQDLVPDSSHGDMHGAVLNLDEPGVALRFRSATPLEYARFEFFVEPVDIGELHDHVHEDDSLLQHDEDYVRLAEGDDHDLAHQGHELQSRTGDDDLAVRGQELITSCNKRRMAGYTRGVRRDVTIITVDHKNTEINTASAYEKMRVEAERSGVHLKVVSGFRTMAEQQYFYNCYQTKRCNNGNLAARPGYSNHQNGLALDLNTSAAGVYNWLNRNASRFGFKRTVPSEPWHWEYRAGTRVSPQVCSAPPAPPPPSPPWIPPYNGQFSDDDGSVHEAGIEAIYRRGVTRGCAAARAGRPGHGPLFCPNRTVTRANMAILLARALNLPRAQRDYFHDDNGTSAEAAINSLAYRGITSGCDSSNPGKFCPGNDVTRGQLAAMLDRALILAPTSRDYFRDDNGSFYEAAANRLAKAGIIRGCADGRFCGDRKVTRGELATILARTRGWLPGYTAQKIAFVGQFADDDGSIHESSIEYIYAEGIVSGCRGGERPLYCPNDAQRRDHMAVMLVRAFHLPPSNVDRFNDDDGMNTEDAINALTAAGVTNGCAADKFCPTDTLTLGQAAIFLLRASGIDAAVSSQEEAIATLVGMGVINRPGCTTNPQCKNANLNRAETASLLARVMQSLPDRYHYVRIRGTSASPEGLNQRVNGLELDAVVLVPGAQSNLTREVGASSIVSSTNVTAPELALGLPTNTSCNNLTSTVADIAEGGELVLRFDAPISRGDRLKVVRQAQVEDCFPGGKLEIAVSRDATQWTVIQTHATANPTRVTVNP